MRRNAYQVLTEKYETILELSVDDNPEVSQVDQTIRAKFPNAEQADANLAVWTSLVNGKGAANFSHLIKLFNMKGPGYFTREFGIRQAIQNFVTQRPAGMTQA